MGPSDGKWSSRTAWSLRWTTDSVRCVEQLVHARRAAWSRRVMRLNRPTPGRRSARLTHKMWLAQSTRGTASMTVNTWASRPMRKTWPEETSETDVGHAAKTCQLRSGSGKRDIALTHGPQEPHEEAWPHWTSEGNATDGGRSLAQIFKSDHR